MRFACKGKTIIAIFAHAAAGYASSTGTAYTLLYYMDGLIIGLLLPLLGTALGAAGVFFLKDKLPVAAQKAMLGFASGVMVAASVWSLLIPAIAMEAGRGKWAVLPAAAGLAAGFAFLLLMDKLVPHLHLDTNAPEGLHSKLSRTSMLMLAVTLHNIPEGMAVGMMLAGVAAHDAEISLSAAIALSVGIAIQNIPEGAIISLPLRAEGKSRRRAFALGALSGAVEPLGALATFALASYITPALPALLAFAAGAMLYVVVEELIPESSQGKHSDIGTIGFASGFILMMVLDVVLG